MTNAECRPAPAEAIGRARRTALARALAPPMLVPVQRRRARWRHPTRGVL